ncbi:MAG TPA: glycosyltransferase family 1 protein [Chloroflexota bacterium]|jgi:glycosyltransferase involved in cell wall biosynthesis|nr:glycosyltransferase family 1 protein [Chloroflexota bacterium]
MMANHPSPHRSHSSSPIPSSRALRIGLDLTGLWRRRTGIFRYADSISHALLARDDGVAYTLFYRRGEAPPVAPRAGLRLVATPVRQERLAMQLWFPLARHRLGLDAIHYPAFPPPLLQQRGMIASIHDLTALRYPQTMTLAGRRYWGPTLRHAARTATPVLAPSRSTYADLVQLAGAAPERVMITPYAADPSFGRRPTGAALHAIRRRWQLPERFLLAVGTLEPRKNLSTLFAALERLRSTLDPPPILVVAGREGWGDVTTSARLRMLGSAVCFTGHVGEAELIALYHLASVFVYPSRYEGFGFPVLEAFWADCPVVTTNSSSIPEVASEAAVLVDPLDAEAMATAIHAVWTDSRLAARLRAAGAERTRQFTWHHCAELTVAAYRHGLAEADE